MPDEEDKKLEYLKREEVKTMQKDVAELREKEAKQEREKISHIKTEEEMQREKEREKEAQKAAMERKLAEKEASRKEEEVKRLKEERTASAKAAATGEEKQEGQQKEGFKEIMRETQAREEEERKRFLERVEAKAESKEEPPSSPPPPLPPVMPEKKILKPFLKRPSLLKRLWTRAVLIILVLAIIAGVVIFWYWYLVVREVAEEKIEEEIVEEIIPETPEIPELLITERILEWGYHIPTTPRIIDTIVIHSTYNVFSEDPHALEGVIQEYKYYGVAPHYLIAQDGIIYLLAPDEAVAYHAGLSQMPDGRTNVNEFSIGIELIQTKTEVPTEAQYQSLTQLVKYLKKEYNILPENILGHKDISPDRKTDPWNFDWEKFNQLIQ